MNTLINGKQRWELLYDHVANNMNDGDFISHQQIEMIIQASYKNPATGTTTSLYGSVVAKAIKELTRVQKRFISIRGQGYRVMFDNEYIYDAATNFKKAHTYIRKALFILDNTPVTGLTAAERSIYNTLYNYAKLTDNFVAKKSQFVQSFIGAAKKAQKVSTVKPVKSSKTAGKRP